MTRFFQLHPAVQWVAGLTGFAALTWALLSGVSALRSLTVDGFTGTGFQALAVSAAVAVAVPALLVLIGRIGTAATARRNITAAS